MIEHTLSTFLDWDHAFPIVIVSHADDAALLSPILQRLDTGERIVTVTGGATRQQSVLAGLEALASEEATHVMIHDAVRPFVPVDMLERIVALHRAGASGVLPALSVTDTLKRGSMVASWKRFPAGALCRTDTAEFRLRRYSRRAPRRCRLRKIRFYR